MNSPLTRIMIVEDEAAHAEIIRRSLQAAGMNTEIQIAGTLREYRKRLDGGFPDIALVDLNLPDGRATEVLTSPSESGPFPILIMTSYGSEEIAVEAMKAGALDYLVKSQETFSEMPRIVSRALREWNLLQDRKRAEEALSLSEVRYRRLFESAKDGILILDAETGMVVDVNPFLIEMLGYSLEQFTGKTVWELGFFKDVIANRDNFLELQRKEYIRYEDLPLETVDGRRREVEFISNVYLVGPKKVIQCNIRDITERKRMEKAAKDALIFHNVLLSTQQETSLDGILVVDENGRRISSNRRFVDMWGIPSDVAKSKSDERALQSVMDKLAVPEEFLSKVQHLNENRQETSWDEIALKDGRTFDRYSAPMLGSDGKYFGRVWYFRDITERKLDEEQIRKDLQEKELLLKEIHHRVKNNLTVISSLLNLQAKQIKTKQQALEAFKESRDRVFAMALIHEKLYQSHNFASVDIKSYLDDMAQQLIHMYRVSQNIRLKLDIEDAVIDINRAIPCGLILNELITNALKHAFPEDRKGAVTVSFRPFEETFYELIVSDDGVGLPADFDVEHCESLGLHLVHLLTSQINGVCTLNREKGTAFRIQFPRTEG